jgi:hypothetical protein
MTTRTSANAKREARNHVNEASRIKRPRSTKARSSVAVRTRSGGGSKKIKDNPMDQNVETRLRNLRRAPPCGPPRRQRPVHYTLARITLGERFEGREPLHGPTTRSDGGSKKIKDNPWTRMLRHDSGI